MVSIGWALGTIEGICITICIGFSVDFVVHVAIAYVEADILLNRYEKTKKALGEMGISVLGATITTGMSSFIISFALSGAPRRGKQSPEAEGPSAFSRVLLRIPNSPTASRSIAASIRMWELHDTGVHQHW